MAAVLVHVLGFSPSDILLLSDALPDTPYLTPNVSKASSPSQRKSAGSPSRHAPTTSGGSETSPRGHPANGSGQRGEATTQADGGKGREKKAGGTKLTTDRRSDVEKAQVNPYVQLWPTKRNILTAVNWLSRDSRPGDVLVFYFAGHGVQVDNMSGWEGEGYDEALLPMDYFNGPGDDWNVLTTIHLKDLLLDIDREAQLTIILDCAGGQTMLDPAGTDSGWSFIKGVKQKGIWPFLTNPTNKVYRATYDPSVWTHPDMQRHMTRPRYIPGIEVDSTAALIDPSLQQAPSTAIVTAALCFAAAPWGQVCVEAIFPSLPIHSQACGSLVTVPDRPVVHGVFTYAFVCALVNLLRGPRQPTAEHLRGVPYRSLIAKVHDELSRIKKGRLPNLNQSPELTVYTGGGCSPNDLFATAWGGNTRRAHLSPTNGPRHPPVLHPSPIDGIAAHFAAARPGLLLTLPLPHSSPKKSPQGCRVLPSYKYLTPEMACREMTARVRERRESDPAFVSQRHLDWNVRYAKTSYPPTA
eukprot:GHVS01034000.1.p2 GENE.GHVS01034000.1~~GHVS01034000.1.p2  ORF type:complete len:561 (-),score=84.71 GHVS01034000.1:2011-3585(-)